MRPLTPLAWGRKETVQVTGQVRTADQDLRSDRQAQRRAARREASRAEILDAAEKVFGRDGLRDGSLRKIAAESGFSTAAIYLFFDNKQDLVAETLARRGVELLDAVRKAAAGDDAPLAKLHRIVDVTVGFFDSRPHFRRLLGHFRGGDAIIGPTLGGFDTGADGTFGDVMTVLTDLVRDGQHAGEVRDGDARVLAHLYSVLINEFVLLTSAEQSHPGTLTSTQFHGLIDGAFASRLASRSARCE